MAKVRRNYQILVYSQAFVSSPDCDCACAYTPCTESAPLVVRGANYRASGSARPFPLLNDWQGIFLPDGASPLIVLNDPAYELWSRFRDGESPDLAALDAPAQQAVQEMLAAGLLQPEHKHPKATAGRQQSAILSAWVHLTDKCNLRCDYCYLPHKREDMSLETGLAAVDAVFRSAVRHGYQKVKLKYAGGEPLLRFDLIQELHPYAQKLAAEHGLELDGVVLSNGTLLTQSTIENLKSLNLRLMVSLDGVGGWHNTQRPYAGGRGSFEDVAAGIELAQAHGITPQISITVSGRNAAGLPEVIEWVLERKLPFSINFYRQNAFSKQHEDLKLEEKKIIAGMGAALEVIERNLPEHSLLASLTDRANLAVPHERTCSAGRDYLVFNQHGGVAKCQMQMGEPLTDLHVEDPLTIIREDKLGLQNLTVDEKEGCRDCPWKHYCAGGCPLETYRATGRYDVKSPNCAIYRAIFPEVLRVEGLRLIRQAEKQAVAVR